MDRVLEMDQSAFNALLQRYDYLRYLFYILVL